MAVTIIWSFSQILVMGVIKCGRFAKLSIPAVTVKKNEKKNWQGRSRPSITGVTMYEETSHGRDKSA